MKMSLKSIVGAVFTLCLISVVVLYTTDRKPQNAVESHLRNSESSQRSGDSKQFLSERKKRIKGLVKHDRPDLFAQYHRDIRTRVGEARPGYKFNYQIEELLRAKNLRSTKRLATLAAADSIGWVERGPGNVSGRTRGVLVDPRDPNADTWIVGSVGGGVWKTTDAGETWVHLTEGLTNLATSALAMPTSNPDVIYVGTGEGFGNVDQINGSGIWKTTDGGQSWEQLASTANFEFQNITRLIVDPNNSDLVLASTSAGWAGADVTSGIHRSTDGGQSWTKVYDTGSLFPTVEHIIADPTNFNIQYATINGTGVIKSTDGGQTWTDASDGIVGVGRMEIAIAPTDPNRIYMSAQGGQSGSILYVSEDAATTWLPSVDVSGNNRHWLGGQGWYDNTIAVHPFDENIVFVGGVNLFQLDVQPGSEIIGPTLQGIDYENTSSFLAFQPFTNRNVADGIAFGTVTASERVSVELRFGPGMSQMAHRFLVPEGENAGVPDNQYTYQDYVEVPFELWDIDNNVQLHASFRDQTRNGVWELEEPIDQDRSNSREYLFFSREPYDPDNPHPSIAQTGGHTHQQLYFIWPLLTPGATWEPNNLPEATLRIRWGLIERKTIAATVVTDGYGQFGGQTKGVHVDHHNIVLIPTDEVNQEYRFLNANDGGVAFSDDAGLTFTQIGSFNTTGPVSGYNTTQFYGVDKKNGANEFIGGMQDNSTWRSPTGQNATASSGWQFQFGGDGFQAVWHYDDPQKILGSIQFNNIQRSLNGGLTWQSATSNMDDVGGGSAPFFTKLAKSKQDPELVFAMGASGLWRTDTFADRWELVEMPSGFSGTSSFAQVKISLANPQVVWAGSHMVEDHPVLGDSPLFVSTDGGLTFEPTTIYSDVTLGAVTGVATHPTDENTAYALFSFANGPKILRTTDLGQTWEDISGFGTGSTSTTGFPDVGVFSLLVMPFDTDIIWAGTEIGIFESTDGGATWHAADNGFPYVSVFEMLIVNDQVVVATHGRGVWSVSLPELEGYEPLPATRAVRLNNVSGGAAGIVDVDASLRSPYDSTQVVVDGAAVFTLDANAAAVDTNFTVSVSVTEETTVSVAVQGFKEGRAHRSFAREVTVFPLLEARFGYVNDFNSFFNNDFAVNGFSVTGDESFDTRALHSEHPYQNSVQTTAQLKIPITLAEEDAMLTYQDVAIVEPGAPGSEFGDSDFRDYVVVEGSNDNGVTWVPLADGYDARFDSDWLLQYNALEGGNSSLFVSHEINLLDTFSNGETILIRFRLFADSEDNAWGWVIDNVEIQPTLVSVAENEEQLPDQFGLAQNYPNPFNPTTNISYDLPRTAEVSLVIYNMRGEEVRRLVRNQSQTAGRYTVQWDGRNDSGRSVSSGVYFYRIQAGDFVKSFKMMLIK